jgi:hypothetical protein
MGWTFTQGATRTDIIREAIAMQENEYGKWTCLAHYCKGNTLWTVWEILIKAQNETQRYIQCDLMECQKGYGWGRKSLEESSHPYYYSCPLKYLDMAPEKNPEWRKLVREHHDHQVYDEMKAAWSKLQTGQKIILRLKPHWNIQEATLERIWPIRARAQGLLYRIKKETIESFEIKED